MWTRRCSPAREKVKVKSWTDLGEAKRWRSWAGNGTEEKVKVKSWKAHGEARGEGVEPAVERAKDPLAIPHWDEAGSDHGLFLFASISSISLYFVTIFRCCLFALPWYTIENGHAKVSDGKIYLEVRLTSIFCQSFIIVWVSRTIGGIWEVVLFSHRTRA